jgi:hypothetical protein
VDWAQCVMTGSQLTLEEDDRTTVNVQRKVTVERCYSLSGLGLISVAQ